MDRSEKLMFLSTFVFGVLTGVYLYFVGFEPLGISAPDRSTGTDESFSVIAEERGTCSETDRGCGSYRLSGNRDYRFVRSTSFGEQQATQEGLLSRNLFDPFVDELNRGFQLGGLENYPERPPACADSVDDIRYRVTIADFGTFYLAACAIPDSDEDDLLQALERISETFPF